MVLAAAAVELVLVAGMALLQVTAAELILVVVMALLKVAAAVRVRQFGRRLQMHLTLCRLEFWHPSRV